MTPEINQLLSKLIRSLCINTEFRKSINHSKIYLADRYQTHFQYLLPLRRTFMPKLEFPRTSKQLSLKIQTGDFLRAPTPSHSVRIKVWDTSSCALPLSPTTFLSSSAYPSGVCNSHSCCRSCLHAGCLFSWSLSILRRKNNGLFHDRAPAWTAHGGQIVRKQEGKIKKDRQKIEERCLRRGQQANESSDNTTYELAAAGGQTKIVCIVAFMCVPLVCNI